jgi:hypothetical protein
MRIIAIGIVAEGGVRAGGKRLRLRQLQSTAQLMLVVGIAQRLVLVEPLGGQRLGGHAPALPPVLGADLSAQDALDAVAYRDHAERKGRRRVKDHSKRCTSVTRNLMA